MVFTQHQKFLLKHQKYCSPDYLKISYFKFSDQYFYGSGQNLRSALSNMFFARGCFSSQPYNRLWTHKVVPINVFSTNEVFKKHRRSYLYGFRLPGSNCRFTPGPFCFKKDKLCNAMEWKIVRNYSEAMGEDPKKKKHALAYRKMKTIFFQTRTFHRLKLAGQLSIFCQGKYCQVPYVISHLNCYPLRHLERNYQWNLGKQWVSTQKENYKLSTTIKNYVISLNESSINKLAKRQRFISNSLKGILLVNFPEKEKNFLIKNLAAENKIPLITQSASLLLKDSRNMDDLLGVDDPIQILFDKVKTCIPCICFINNLDRIGKQRYESTRLGKNKSLHWLNYSISLLINNNIPNEMITAKPINQPKFSTSMSKFVMLQDQKPLQIHLQAPPHLLHFAKQWGGTPFDKQTKKAPVPLYYQRLFKQSRRRNVFKHERVQSFKVLKAPGFFDKKSGRTRVFNVKNTSALKADDSFKPHYGKWTKNKQKFKTNYYHKFPVWLCNFKFISQHPCGPEDILNYPSNHTDASLGYQNGSYNNKIPRPVEQMLKTSTKKIKWFGFYDNVYIPLKVNFYLQSSGSVAWKFWVFNQKLTSPMKINFFQTLSSKIQLVSKKPEFKTIIASVFALKTQTSFVISKLKQQTAEKKSFKFLSISDDLSINRLSSRLLFIDCLSQAEKDSDESSFSPIGVSKRNTDVASSHLPHLEKPWGESQTKPVKKQEGISIYDAYTNTNQGIENNKNNSPKITETDIIKRTALLKFLQILDGFHTPTEKKKPIGHRLIFFSYSNFKIPLRDPLKKFNLSKILRKLPKTFNSDFAHSKIKTSFWQTSPVLSPQIKPKKSFHTELGPKTNISKAAPSKVSHYATVSSGTKFKINYKLSLSIKNFWNAFVWPKKLKTLVVSKNRLTNTTFYLKLPYPTGSRLLGIWPSFFNLLKNDALGFRWAGLNQNHQMLVSQQASLYERKLKLSNNIFFSQPSRLVKPKIDKKKWILNRQKFSASVSTLSFPIAWYISSNLQNLHGTKRQVDSRPLANDSTSVFPKKQRFSFNRSKDLIAKKLLFKLSFSVFGFHPTALRLAEIREAEPEPILQKRGVPKYEIYLKNQSSNKSLNLLCVWPSYLEDILGPFNLNDSGSYILPEYFQLLGHGPKLKKQGITLIASTNNLTNLDAALLRPGRFDTIINFSYSFSSIYRSSKMLKHSACLTQNNLFSYYKLYTREKKHISLRLNSLKGDKSLNRQAEKYDSSKSFFPLVLPRSTSEARPGILLNTSFVHSESTKSAKPWGSTQESWIKRSTDFNRLDIWTCSTTNILAEKNNFYSQFSRFDKTNQSTPMKTFLDVSIFIHHKLWWSFYNEKSFWPGVNQKITRIFPKNTSTAPFLNIQKSQSLIQKSRQWPVRTKISDSKKLKTFFFGSHSIALRFAEIREAEPNIYNCLVVLPVKGFVKLKNLTDIFIDILRIIYFKFFYNIFKFFIIFKNLLNQKIITSQSDNNQDFDSISHLSREVLISKMLTLGLSKKENSFGFHPITSPISSLERNESQAKAPFAESRQAESHGALQIYDVPKAETFNLASFVDNNKQKTRPYLNVLNPDANEKKKTTQNFRYNLHTEDNNMFLKSNRSFLFCTGDFNYKIFRGRAATEKNDSIVLLTEKSYKKKYRWTNIRPILSGMFFWPSNFTNRESITNSFLDPSSKIWKPLEAKAVKNVKINHVKLTKYNQIYKLKKTKSKQFFFNLHPFTCLILKRWLEITKFNKLKSYLKVPLVKNILPQFNLLLYLKTKQNSSITKNFWFLNSQANSLNKNYPDNPIFDNLYSMTLLTPTNNSWLNHFVPGSNSPSSLGEKAVMNPTHESYLFKKLSINSSLNITCLQTYGNLINSGRNSWISSLELLQVHSRLKKIPRKTMFSDKLNYFPGRCKIKTFNAKTNQLEINNNIILLKNLKEFFVPDFVSHKMKKLFVQSKSVDYSSTLLSMVLSEQTNLSKKDAALLGVVHSLSEDTHSPILRQASTHLPHLAKQWGGTQAPSFVSLQANQWEETEKLNDKRDLIKRWESIQNYKMCRLDISFFLLTFYTMFFEKIQTKNVNFLSTFLSILVSKQNKNTIPPVISLNMKSWAKTQPNQLTLNTIKVFMPYKSLIISHFLLSQSSSYNFSCKNFEILIYNKFKNFLVDF